MKQKTDLELLSEDGKLIRSLISKHLENWDGLKMASVQNYLQSGKMSGSLFIAVKEMMKEYALKSNQLQATVDELKQGCEELEKYAIHKPNCARLQRPFGSSVTVCNDSITCTCGLDNLLTPNERK